MCRALRRPRKNYAGDRPDDLKQALKPYRDNHVNRLRAVAGSARVNLNERWKSLENLFAAADRDRGRSDRHSEERAENAVNEMLEEDGENARPADPTSDAVQRLRRLHVDR